MTSRGADRNRSGDPASAGNVLSGYAALLYVALQVVSSLRKTATIRRIALAITLSAELCNSTRPGTSREILPSSLHCSKLTRKVEVRGSTAPLESLRLAMGPPKTLAAYGRSSDARLT